MKHRPYRDAVNLIERICREHHLDYRCADGLSEHCLAAIEAGQIPERDVKNLLTARHVAQQRESNRQKRRAA